MGGICGVYLVSLSHMWVVGRADDLQTSDVSLGTLMLGTWGPQIVSMSEV